MGDGIQHLYFFFEFGWLVFSSGPTRAKEAPWMYLAGGLTNPR
jgi:hypothetical protein